MNSSQILDYLDSPLIINFFGSGHSLPTQFHFSGLLSLSLIAPTLSTDKILNLFDARQGYKPALAHHTHKRPAFITQARFVLRLAFTGFSHANRVHLVNDFEVTQKQPPC